jgi:hypothetical protein
MKDGILLPQTLLRVLPAMMQCADAVPDLTSFRSRQDLIGLVIVQVLGDTEYARALAVLARAASEVLFSAAAASFSINGAAVAAAARLAMVSQQPETQRACCIVCCGAQAAQGAHPPSRRPSRTTSEAEARRV